MSQKLQKFVFTLMKKEKESKEEVKKQQTSTKEFFTEYEKENVPDEENVVNFVANEDKEEQTKVIFTPAKPTLTPTIVKLPTKSTKLKKKKKIKPLIPILSLKKLVAKLDKDDEKELAQISADLQKLKKKNKLYNSLGKDNESQKEKWKQIKAALKIVIDALEKKRDFERNGYGMIGGAKTIEEQIEELEISLKNKGKSKGDYITIKEKFEKIKKKLKTKKKNHEMSDEEFKTEMKKVKQITLVMLNLAKILEYYRR